MADVTSRSDVPRGGGSEISSPPDESPSEGERLLRSSSTAADTDPPAKAWSDALRAFVRTQPERATSTAGQLVIALFESHPHYLDKSPVVLSELAGLGL